MSQPADDKLSLKGAWSGSRDHFRILHPLKYLWNGWSCNRQILCGCSSLYQVLVFEQLIVSERGVARVTWPPLE